MKKTNTKIFAMCLVATMVGTTTNFTTRTLAAETTQPTVQRLSDKVTKKVPGVSVKKITLDKKIDLQVGTGATKTTQQLSATITPTNATNKNVTWMSSNTKIATVSSTGLVTAVKAGSAKITVQSAEGHKKATSKLTVKTVTAGNSDQIDSLWTQKWNDEFSGVNGTTTDARKWVFDIGKGPDGDGWGNQELETYTSSTDNVYQKDGNLVIAAKKDAAGNITSGRIKTKGSLDMKYGRVDVRAKLPTGAGYWPAIWMLPSDNVYGVWASSGELDIMENKGRLPNEVYGTLHYGAAWPNNRYTGKTYNFPSGTDVTSFHTYSMEWEPGEIRWYVDGHLYQTQNNWSATDTNGEKIAFPAPFDQNFHLILNLAYGGTFDGSIGDKSNVPGEMEVDYVRAYDLTGRPYKTATQPIVNVEALPTGAKQADSSGNLLSNGDFSTPIKENPTGTLPYDYAWNFVHSTDTGTGNAAIETIADKNYAKINVTNPGAKNYSVQLIQQTTLGKGRWYKLSFDAKTDTSRNIGVKIGGGSTRGYASYADPATFDLTDKFKSFEITFQMSENTDVIGNIEYELGLSTNPVWIGNTRLEEISAPIQNADASKEPLVDGNRIYNGTFDKGSIDRMAYWDFNVTGAAATASVSEATRELFVNVSNGAAEPSAITLKQKGIQLTQKSVYELKFKARAEAPKTIHVGVLSKDGTVSYNDEKTLNLTTEMKEQTVSFTMDKATDLESQIVFKLGGDNNDVYMDDVSLIPTYEFIDYSLIDCYPLKNGDFSKGLDSWSPYPNIGDGGASTIIAANGEAKITVTAPGPNPYSVMLNQEGLKFTKGVEYLLAFDVKSTVDRNITATIDNADYDQYLSKTVQAGTEMTHYEYTLKLSKDDTVNLKFLLGNVDAEVPTAAHDIFIDNVKLEVKNAPFKNPPTLAPSETNNKLTQPIDVTFSDDAAWTEAITSVNINDTVVAEDKYTIAAGKITFAAENFPTVNDYTIVVIADGYANNTCVQNIKANNNLIINNGTFDTNVSGWENYIADGSDATITSVDGKMKVNFPNYGGWEKWSTQVYQDTIQLEAGKKYVLSFDASSTVARDAWLEMSNLEAQTIALTPTNKTFTYEFTAASTITNGKLNFLLGTSNLDGSLFTKDQSVSIDNVSIIEKIATPTNGDVIAVSQTDTTVINATSAFNIVNGSLVDNDTTETGKSLQTNVTSPMTFDFNVNVAAAGKYSVTFRENSTPAGCDLSLVSNGITKFSAAGPGEVNATTYSDVTREIDLKAGEQIISISGVPGSASMLKIKSITLKPIEMYTPPVIVGDLTAIPSNVPTKLEAEDAINVKNATVALNDIVEGGSSLKATANMTFDFNVDVAVAGQYQITYRTNCGPDGLDIFLKSNGMLLKQVAAPSGSTWGNTTMTVSLDAGPQVLSINGVTGAGSTIQINNIILTPMGGGSTGGATSISNTAPTVLQAESAINVTNASVVANDTTIGGSSLKSTAPGNPMTFDFNVNVATAGQYTMTYRTATIGPSGVYMELSKGGVMINGIGVGPSEAFTDTTVTVTLAAGAQVLKVFGAPGESTILKVDKVTISPQ